MVQVWANGLFYKLESKKAVSRSRRRHVLQQIIWAVIAYDCKPTRTLRPQPRCAVNALSQLERSSSQRRATVPFDTRSTNVPHE